MMSMFWIHRIGRAEVPVVLGDALAGRQDVEALVALRLQEVPAALQVADQAVRLVLGRDGDAADAGIERIGQREIDDARLAAEIDRGLGAPIRQLHQPGAAPAGEHIGHRVAGKGRAGGVTSVRHGFLQSHGAGAAAPTMAIMPEAPPHTKRPRRRLRVAQRRSTARGCPRAVADSTMQRNPAVRRAAARPRSAWRIRRWCGRRRTSPCPRC